MFQSGVVTSDYAIQSLPQRLIGETLKLGDYFVETPLTMKKRSVQNQPENYTTCIAVMDIPQKANISRLSKLHIFVLKINNFFVILMKNVSIELLKY